MSIAICQPRLTEAKTNHEARDANKNGPIGHDGEGDFCNRENGTGQKQEP